MLLGYLAVMCLSGGEGAGDFLEHVIKRTIIQENPVIVVISVETIFNLTNGSRDFPKIRISGEGDEGRIHSLTRRRWGKREEPISGHIWGHIWGES